MEIGLIIIISADSFTCMTYVKLCTYTILCDRKYLVKKLRNECIKITM